MELIMPNVADIAARHNLHRHNDRYAGPCPKCGGSARSDKFVMREDGGFKCYCCDFKGDYIAWLRQMEGMSCPEAHEAAGKACEHTTCPARGTCRLGDGSGKTTRAAAIVRPQHKRHAPALPTATVRQPVTTWAAWAESFVGKCHDELSGNARAINELQQRGITWPAACRARLGWNPESTRVDRRSIGLPVTDKPNLWLPAGLVIPTLVDGAVHRVKIRRRDEDRARFKPDLKYVWIDGSGSDLMHIAPTGKSRGVVIVEAELDAIACAAAHPDVHIIALGTVSAGLSPALQRVAAVAPVILVALDADEGRDGQAGAGAKAVARWVETYRRARYWPVPDAKDPGDYVRAGGSLRPWIEAGLIPPTVAAVTTAEGQDEQPLPLNASPGGEGVAIFGKSAAGQDYIVVETRGAWRNMVAEHPGVAVVGAKELEKIDPRNAEDVLRVKAIFGEAEVLGCKHF